MKIKIELVDSLIGLNEAGEILNVHRATLVSLIKSGHLKAVMVGKTWKVRKSVVERALEQGLNNKINDKRVKDANSTKD